MADNVAVTEGAGKSVATDDVGGQQYQRVKLDFGTDGAAAPALAGAGVVATGVQRVTLASDDPAVTALQIMDDWDDGNYCNVNLNVAGTDVAANAGVLSAQTIRVTIATDDECNNFLGTIDADTGNMVTALQLLDNAVDGNYLNCNLNIAGTDCVGNAGVLAAGVLRVTIATDDEVNNLLGTIDTDTGNMVTALQLLDNAVDGNYLNVNLNVAGTDAAAGEGVISAQTQRVTLATDDDGVAHLATIAGAVAATHMQCDIVAGTVTTVSTVTTLSQLGGQAISMGEGVVAAGCQRVTLATDDDGVAHLATIAADTNNIETAIQIMDDWDATHAGAASADGPQVMGAGYSTALPADVGADADAARICTDRHGRIVRGLMPQWFNAIFNSADASAEANIVKAKTASRKIYILSLTISVDAEMWVELQDEDSNAITPKFWLKAGGGLTKTYPPEAPLVLNVVNKDLEVITEGAGNIGVEVTGYLAV